MKKRKQSAGKSDAGPKACGSPPTRDMLAGWIVEDLPWMARIDSSPQVKGINEEEALDEV
jgi:hypothetical protein